VEQPLGKTNRTVYLRLKVETPDGVSLDRLLHELLSLGCAPADSSDAHLELVERDRCAPEDFYSTTNHKTHVRNGQRWLEVENQRMDAALVVAGGRAYCRRLRDLRAGDQVVVGMRGIRVTPESKERNRLSFAFMSNGIFGRQAEPLYGRRRPGAPRRGAETEGLVRPDLLWSLGGWPASRR
jgi:hypothetical protein